MLIFALIVVVIFSFVFDPGSEQMQASAPGILWIAITFAGNLGLSRSFTREQEQSTIHGLLLCPVDKSLIYLGKMIANVIFMVVTQIVIIPVMIILFDLSFSSAPFLFVLILLLGTIGFSAVGTVFSTISANTKSREVMLPILLFPIIVPVLLAATKATAYIINARDIQQVWSWIRVLLGFDIIFLVICFLLYEYVLEE
jgi:heme exporter protein B